MATATLPLMFRVTKGYFTLHRPLHRSNHESEGFHALPLTFRVMKGYSTHHRTLPRLNRESEGFHGNGNPSTHVSSDKGVFHPPQHPPTHASSDEGFSWQQQPFHSHFG